MANNRKIVAFNVRLTHAQATTLRQIKRHHRCDTLSEALRALIDRERERLGVAA